MLARVDGVDVPEELDAVESTDVEDSASIASEVKENHCSDVFWHPIKMVWDEGSQTREKRSPAWSSRYGRSTKRGFRVLVDHT